MFKNNKMRRIVESHLEEVEVLLEHSRKRNDQDGMKMYMSQKMTIEHILKDFEKIGA